MIHLEINKYFKFTKRKQTKCTRAHMCMCVHLIHGRQTVIFLLYYFEFRLYLIIIKIYIFLISYQSVSDIFFFLHFNIKDMKQANFKLFNSDCDSLTFNIVDFRCVVRFCDFLFYSDAVYC